VGYKTHDIPRERSVPLLRLRLRPQLFLGFTQTLTFPAGYDRSSILLGRDTTYT